MIFCPVSAVAMSGMSMAQYWITNKGNLRKLYEELWQSHCVHHESHKNNLWWKWWLLFKKPASTRLNCFTVPNKHVITHCSKVSHIKDYNAGINNVSLLNFVNYPLWWRRMRPVTVAALSKARTAFARSNAGVVRSNHTQSMDVCVHLFCVCVVLCVGRGIAAGWSPVQGVLPTAYRIKKLEKRPRSTRALKT
jgi:hypothetical protein